MAGLRNRDLTPSSSPALVADLKNMPAILALPDGESPGGAQKFYEFIEEEVKPFINSQYRISENNETLIGNLLGGAFDAYVLLTHDTFDKYLIGSPSLWIDRAVFESYVEQLRNRNNKSHKRVFISVGADENEIMTSGARWLYDQLVSSEHVDLEIKYHVLEGTHSSVRLAILAEGLKYLMPAEND